MATIIKDIQEESDKITKVKRIIKNRSEKLEKKNILPTPLSEDVSWKELPFSHPECPTFFLRTLYEYVREHPNCDYHDACLACFKEEAKNNDDIIRNYINNYSRI